MVVEIAMIWSSFRVIDEDELPCALSGVTLAAFRITAPTTQAHSSVLIPLVLVAIEPPFRASVHDPIVEVGRGAAWHGTIQFVNARRVSPGSE